MYFFISTDLFFVFLVTIKVVTSAAIFCFYSGLVPYKLLKEKIKSILMVEEKIIVKK